MVKYRDRIGRSFEIGSRKWKVGRSPGFRLPTSDFRFFTVQAGDRWRIFTWLWLLLLPLAGCAPERDRSAEVEALIRKTVDDQLASYRRVRMERCREDILQEASRIADSLMILEARLEIDSLHRPPRPLRPERPELRPLLDTTPVKPLFRDTSGG